MKWTDIEGLVPTYGPAAAAVDFQACLEAFPQLEEAKTTPQDPIHHAEGDVWTHTKMVVDALLALPEYQALPRREQVICFLAALLHDLAKCSTTVHDPDGRIRQPGHSRRGAIDARIALWDAGAPFLVRESICRIIETHQVPMYLMAAPRPAAAGAPAPLPPEFTMRRLSWHLDTRLLALVAQADMIGRICADAPRTLDNIELFRELAREEGCFGRPRPFADAHTRVSYFRGADVHPDYPLFQEPGSRVTMMSALPASGKDTWVAQHRRGLAVVSQDDARAELGLRHGQNEGSAAHMVVDKARELLRRREPFIWNATFLTPPTRQKALDLLFGYGAEVEIVCLEQPRATLLKRNDRRDTSLSNDRLQEMVAKWEPPLPSEAHFVRYQIDGGEPQEWPWAPAEEAVREVDQAEEGHEGEILRDR